MQSGHVFLSVLLWANVSQNVLWCVHTWQPQWNAWSHPHSWNIKDTFLPSLQPRLYWTSLFSACAESSVMLTEKISVYHAIFTSKLAPIWTFFFSSWCSIEYQLYSFPMKTKARCLRVCMKGVLSLFSATILHRFIELTKVIAPFGKHYQNKARTQRQFSHQFLALGPYLKGPHPEGTFGHPKL